MSALAIYDLAPVGPTTLPKPRRIVLPDSVGGPEPGRVYVAPVFSTDAAAEVYMFCAAIFAPLASSTYWSGGLHLVPAIEAWAAHRTDLDGKSAEEMWSMFGQNGGMGR